MGERCASSTFVDTNVTAHTSTVTSASAWPLMLGAPFRRLRGSGPE